MSSKGKEIVENFYESFYSDSKVLEKYLHPEASLCWHSSIGYREMDFSQISGLTKEMAENYDDLRIEVASLIQEDGQVAIHFTYHVKTIENPEEEMPLAHFMATWELKDNKLYKGYQISQLAE
ncbi:nuclear transport factor 2 family protein [Salegentibacter chungangensis]|uniref:Nuclear transport factor 2 family protein n=1 Tax=Salegentibacter chungangensis TaxID=1335724 RepID=A0ABW3NVB7_9FLAO